MEIVLTTFNIYMAFIFLLMVIAILVYIKTNGFDDSVPPAIGCVIVIVVSYILLDLLDLFA